MTLSPQTIRGLRRVAKLIEAGDPHGAADELISLDWAQIALHGWYDEPRGTPKHNPNAWYQALREIPVA